MSAFLSRASGIPTTPPYCCFMHVGTHTARIRLGIVLARRYCFCTSTDAMTLGLRCRKHILLWLAILFSATSAQQELQPWQQCGGRSKCAESQCADRSWDEVSLYIMIQLMQSGQITRWLRSRACSWLGQNCSWLTAVGTLLQMACPSGFACTRQNEWYYQCRPIRGQCVAARCQGHSWGVATAAVRPNSSSKSSVAQLRITNACNRSAWHTHTEAALSPFCVLILNPAAGVCVCRHQRPWPCICEGMAAVWRCQWMQQH